MRKPGGMSARRPPAMRSRAVKQEAKKAGHVMVCLIGFEHAMPRFVGDNLGALPVRVTTAKRKRDAASKEDLSSPLVRVVVLESVAVETEAHAKRLKEALHEALHGHCEDAGNKPLRHSWRDASGCFTNEHERAMWWGVLLQDALVRVRRMAASFKVMTASQSETEIATRARRRVSDKGL